MQITKEHIAQRIAQVETLRDQHLAAANAAEGELLGCRFWLAKLDEAEPEAKSDDKG